MTEKLEVLIGGKEHDLDLNCPSGITLNYKSNLFGDLSKITCSYTYTFRLPLTRNNREIFCMVDDIRSRESFGMKRVECRYYQNGIDLLGKANLYISEVDETFDAVMTWQVLDGFALLKESGKNLNELFYQTLDTFYYGREHIYAPESYDNTVNALYPQRRDYIYHYSNGRYIRESSYVGDLPVIPIRKLIDFINTEYGVKFKLGGAYDGKRFWDNQAHDYMDTGDNRLINIGVMPYCDNKLSKYQKTKRIYELNRIEVLRVNPNAFPFLQFDDMLNSNVKSVVTFYPITPAEKYDKYLGFGSGNPATSEVNKCFKIFKKQNYASINKSTLDGYIKVSFSSIYRHYSQGGGTIEEVNTDATPALTLFIRKYERKEGSETEVELKYVEFKAINGEYVSDEVWTDGTTVIEYFVFEYNFREYIGGRPEEITDITAGQENFPLFFGFEEEVRTVKSVSKWTITPEDGITDDFRKGFEMDMISNLPEVSCFDFMKSIFYMIGAFPIVNEDGTIVPIFYNDIEEKLLRGNYVDWSSKLTTQSQNVQAKIKFSLGGFGQWNYFFMKGHDEDDEDDVYDKGEQRINVENSLLDPEKVVIELPFYGAYLKNRKHPYVWVGEDVKNTNIKDDGTEEFCRSNPAIGYIVGVELGEFDGFDKEIHGTEEYGMYLKIWDWNNGEWSCSKSHDFLQKLVKNPKIITEEMNLTEIDLVELDYTVPIYLGKYNSFFALISVQVNNDGVSKVELIKIPN